MVNHLVTVESVTACIGCHSGEGFRPFFNWGRGVVGSRQRLASAIRGNGHHPAVSGVSEQACGIMAICFSDFTSLGGLGGRH